MSWSGKKEKSFSDNRNKYPFFGFPPLFFLWGQSADGCILRRGRGGAPIIESFFPFPLPTYKPPSFSGFSFLFSFLFRVCLSLSEEWAVKSGRSMRREGGEKEQLFISSSSSSKSESLWGQSAIPPLPNNPLFSSSKFFPGYCATESYFEEFAARRRLYFQIFCFMMTVQYCTIKESTSPS